MNKHEDVIVALLSVHGGLTQREISNELGMHRTTVGLTLRKLREKGLVYEDRFRDERGRLKRVWSGKAKDGGKPSVVWRLVNYI